VGFYYIHRPSANWWYFSPSEQIWTLDIWLSYIRGSLFISWRRTFHWTLHTLTIYYIHFCHHCQLPLNPTTLDGAHTHINFLDIQLIFRTVTSSPACCTKTPIRYYLSFYCAVCACTCQVNVSSWQFGVAYCVRCLYIWFILYSVHWLRSVMPIVQYNWIELNCCLILIKTDADANTGCCIIEIQFMAIYF